ncbi:nuclear transport factor 2 family protein [Microbacterium aurugineum]|uniref:nuclear transport factor 2 family protein n=1 Tax=Microbacterium aurugineum TaxID=2851642 RepID=UPI003558700D
MEWVAHGSDAAVAIYTYRWSGTVQGSPANGSGRATNAFVKTGDGWRLVHEHLSALATSATDAASGSGGVRAGSPASAHERRTPPTASATGAPGISASRPHDRSCA